MIQSATGEVFIRNEGGDEWKQISGQGTYFGQHLFIDAVAATKSTGRRGLQDTEQPETQSETSQEPETVEEEQPEPEQEPIEANHRTIGLSFVGEDGLDHISLYKLVESSEGEIGVFDFGIDVIQTTIVPSKRTTEDKVDNFASEGPTLNDGKLIWTTSTEKQITSTDAQGNQVTETKTTWPVQMLTICTPEQFYNATTQECESCPETEGTTRFQETSCRSCADIWFESKDQPNSLEALIATQLCEDPEGLYEQIQAEKAEAERLAREQAEREERERLARLEEEKFLQENAPGFAVSMLDAGRSAVAVFLSVMMIFA